MPDYRRAFQPGGAFFFTLVTYERAPILCKPLARAILHRAIEECRRSRPFEMIASVLLPDHFHAIWQLPPGDADFSSRWSFIKAAFTRGWLQANGSEGTISESRQRNRRCGVWQRRFWEHTLRDLDDLDRHVDYIHYNPVKHGLVRCPHDWQWSSFHRWARGDFYDSARCCVCNTASIARPDFSWADEFDLE